MRTLARRRGVDKAKEVLNALKDVIEQERQSTREKMKTAAGAGADDAPADKKQ